MESTFAAISFDSHSSSAVEKSVTSIFFYVHVQHNSFISTVSFLLQIKHAFT